MDPTDPIEELTAIKAGLRISDSTNAEDGEQMTNRAWRAVVALEDWIRAELAAKA